MKKIAILGDGQIWDVSGIDEKNPKIMFEDLFSGRALGESARLFDRLALKKYGRTLFAQFKEKGKLEVTGVCVTRALLNKKDKLSREAAETLLKEMAGDAARGIELLATGKARKRGWGPKEYGQWKDLQAVIIGAGVSTGKTGAVIIKAIKDYLRKR